MYRIYKIEASNGRMYVGLTSLSLKDRWKFHKLRAFNEQSKLPLYEDIRKFGAEAFTITQIDTAEDKDKANDLEIQHIAALPEDLKYNRSPGGHLDAKAGAEAFWAKCNAEPEYRAEYIQKLSNAKITNDWTDYDALAEAAAKWRKENPREAWKMQHRASRMGANATRDLNKAEPEELTLKARLRKKHKYEEYRRRVGKKNTTRVWAERSEDEVAKIGAAISKAQKERMKEIAVLPDFQQAQWPYAKATCLRKIRQGMGREEIIEDAKELVTRRGSHWRDVQKKLEVMGIYVSPNI